PRPGGRGIAAHPRRPARRHGHRFRAWSARDFQAAIGAPAGRRTHRVRPAPPIQISFFPIPFPVLLIDRSF
ncbi:hypothetical protein, partial [Bordetella pertussis]|uniref:hypothetical protein n=1 Tax=Bordetella pertussis TaxID=520 RepID=UPI001C9E7337